MTLYQIQQSGQAEGYPTVTVTLLTYTSDLGATSQLRHGLLPILDLILSSHGAPESPQNLIVQWL